jgi:hypothetical protein
MPHRRSQANVTQFLRDALAVDALGVPELEARARATGLLGEGQSITHSIKTGSGTARERRVAIPVDWLQGVACLHPDRPPNDVPRQRWWQFVDDCKSFLSSPENWANRATRLGWDAMALFGCAPKRPLDYLGSAGSGTDVIMCTISAARLERSLTASPSAIISAGMMRHCERERMK